jgi:hypothetical protein
VAHRFLVAGAAVLLVALATGCTAAPPSPTPSPHAVAVPSTHQLGAPGSLPALLTTAGATESLALPSGWTIDGYGVRRSGDTLAFTATRSGATPASPHLPTSDLWIVDSASGRSVSDAPEAGWTFAAPVVVDGWVVVRSITAFPDSDCPHDEPGDCFAWRVVALPAPGSTGRARILAHSTGPGSQALTPLFASNGQAAAWEAGASATSSTLYEWSPSMKTPVRLTRLSGQGILSFDGDKLFVSQAPLADGAARHTLTQIPLPGQQVTLPPFTYTASGADDILDGRLVYFPESGDQTAAWRVARIPTATTAAASVASLQPAINSPYTVDWITESELVSYSNSGISLYDVAKGTGTAIASPTDETLTVPRADDGYLDLAWNPSTANASPSIVAWRRFS